MGLIATAVAIGFSASCGGTISRSENGDAGSNDATSSSSGGGSGTGSSSGGMSSSSSGGTCLPPADAFVQASVGTGPMSDSTMCPLGGVAAAWLNGAPPLPESLVECRVEPV